MNEEEEVINEEEQGNGCAGLLVLAFSSVLGLVGFALSLIVGVILVRLLFLLLGYLFF
jgi:hypothetical protein